MFERIPGRIGRVIPLLAVLTAGAFPGPAFGQDFAVDHVAPHDHTVMGEATDTLWVRVTNNKPDEALPTITFKFGGGNNEYDFANGTTAPSGWSFVNPIGDNKLTFTADPGSEIPSGGSVVFQIPLVGNGEAAVPASASDGLDSFDKIEADYPSGRQNLDGSAGGAWVRHALALVAMVDRTSAGPGDPVKLELLVENRSTADQTVTVVSGYPRSDPAGAGISAGPDPALPVTLDTADARSATIAWTFTADVTPSFELLGRFENGAGTATSPEVRSDTIYVGNLTASLSVSPTESASGQQVDVEMTVTNQTTTAMGDVRPEADPASVGTASATLSSGPSPTSVSSLAAGGSATFLWSYTVTGDPLETYVLEGSAVANGHQSPTARSNTGTIAAFALNADPDSIASGNTGPIDFTLDNGTVDVSIDKEIVVRYPSGWVVDQAPAPPGWSSAIKNGGRDVHYVAGAGTSLDPGGRLVFSHTYTPTGVPVPSGGVDEPYRIEAELKPAAGPKWFAETTLTATATRLVLSSDPSPAVAPADGDSTIALTGRLTDVATGNPISGATLSFEATVGALSATSAVTDSNGEATVLVTAPASTVTLDGTASASRLNTVDELDLQFTGVSGPNLLYVGGTIYPREVEPGSLVSFSFTVENTGDADITLPTSLLEPTTFQFTDGTRVFQALLDGSVTIAAGDTGLLKFVDATVDPLFTLGDYYGSFSYNPTHTINDAVTVTNAATFASVVGLDAIAYADGVLLSWSTDLEIANSGFRVLRAAGAGEPERLEGAWIPASGESFSSYEFVDAPVDAGVYAYWIEDVAEDGVATRHGPVAIALGVEPGAGAADSAPAPSSAGLPETGDDDLWNDPSDLGDVRILAHDDDGITYEIRPPPFETTQVPFPVQLHDRIRIPRYAVTEDVGQPDLPIRQLLVPVPANALADMEVLEIDEDTLEGLRPTWFSGEPTGGVSAETFAGEAGSTVGTWKRRKQTSSTYPASAIRLADRGLMGDRRVAALVIAPLRWDRSTERMRRATRMVVRVRFSPAPPAQPKAESAAEAAHRRILSGPSLKVEAVRSGLVRVPASAIVSSGAGDIEDVAVYRRGRVVPSRIEGAELLFFAPEVRTFWSDRHAYWIARRTGSPELLPRTGSVPPAGTEADLVRRVARFEEDRFFAPLSAQGIGPDRWYWAQVASAATTTTVDVPLDGAVESTLPATLAVTLQGMYDAPFEEDEHLVRLALNSVDLGTVRISGFERRTLALAVPPGTIQAGLNELRLVCESAGVSRVALDAVELDLHARADALGGDELVLTAATGGALTAAGFPDAPAYVLDQTDPASPSLLEAAITPDGSGRWNATVTSSAGRVLRFLTASADAPAVWSPRGPGSAMESPSGADYIVIAASDLVDAGAEFAQWRSTPEGGNFRTAVYDIADLYDAASYGDVDPSAARRFLEHARARWPRPSPRYVLLLGDSTYDPRDRLGNGITGGLLLSQHAGTEILSAATDTAIAALGTAGDPLPDIAVGRLPAKTDAQARSMLAKTRAYESAPRDAWASRQTLFADDDLPDFQTTAEESAWLLPRGIEPRTIVAAHSGDTAARVSLLDDLSQGTALASYFGHGGVQNWGGEPYLKIADASLLSSDRPPVIVAFDCLNGSFDHPSVEGLGESLLRDPSAGAAAVWTSSAITRTGGHRELALAFQHAFWREPGLRLGDVVNHAFASVAWRSDAEELIGTFVLFGDPALKPNVNSPPVANARLRYIQDGRAHLTAAASFDEDGDPLAWRWTVVSEPSPGAAALEGSDGPEAVLHASTPGRYRIRLQVADAHLAGPPDDLVVEFQAATPGAAPSSCSTTGTPAGTRPVMLVMTFLALVALRHRRRTG